MHKVSTLCTDAETLTQIMAQGVSKERAIREKKSGMKYSPRSKRLSGIDVYMTLPL